MTDKNGNKVNPFDILGSAMGGGKGGEGKTTSVSGGMTGSVAKSTTSP